MGLASRGRAPLSPPLTLLPSQPTTRFLQPLCAGVLGGEVTWVALAVASCESVQALLDAWRPFYQLLATGLTLVKEALSDEKPTWQAARREALRNAHSDKTGADPDDPRQKYCIKALQAIKEPLQLIDREYKDIVASEAEKEFGVAYLLSRMVRRGLLDAWFEQGCGAAQAQGEQQPDFVIVACPADNSVEAVPVGACTSLDDVHELACSGRPLSARAPPETPHGEPLLYAAGATRLLYAPAPPDVVADGDAAGRVEGRSASTCLAHRTPPGEPLPYAAGAHPPSPAIEGQSASTCLAHRTPPGDGAPIVVRSLVSLPLPLSLSVTRRQRETPQTPLTVSPCPPRPPVAHSATHPRFAHRCGSLAPAAMSASPAVPTSDFHSHTVAGAPLRRQRDAPVRLRPRHRLEGRPARR